jgi:hypothetical protein
VLQGELADLAARSGSTVSRTRRSSSPGSSRTGSRPGSSSASSRRRQLLLLPRAGDRRRRSLPTRRVPAENPAPCSIRWRCCSTPRSSGDCGARWRPWAKTATIVGLDDRDTSRTRPRAPIRAARSGLVRSPVWATPPRSIDAPLLGVAGAAEHSGVAGGSRGRAAQSAFRRDHRTEARRSGSHRDP